MDAEPEPRLTAEAPMHGPQSIPLTGTDWFLVGLDRSMRRRTLSGCVCHLMVELAQPVEARSLTSPWWRWLSALRLRAAPPFVLARWESVGPVGEVVELSATSSSEALALLPASMDPVREPSIRLTLTHMKGGGQVLTLSWHHALLDARTAESVLMSLGADDPLPPYRPPDPPSLSERLALARGGRDFVWEVSVGGLTSPGGWTRAGRSRHRHLMLTDDETARVRQRATDVGVGIIPSTLHVAACSWAVAEMMRSRGQPGDLLVPVPQDRRAGHAAPVGNGISLLFFRVPAGAQADVTELARLALDQVRDMARRRVPLWVATLLDFCRWLPAWLYMLIVAVPTRGRLASFGFSDTGDSLSRLTHVVGVEVTDAWHLPANAHPPGLTFVFSTFRGRLQICLGWTEGVVSDDDIDTLAARLRVALLPP